MRSANFFKGISFSTDDLLVASSLVFLLLVQLLAHAQVLVVREALDILDTYF